MSFLSRFAGTRTNQSMSQFGDDAGLPTKSGVVAGGSCKSQLEACMTSCEKLDQDCVQTCGTAYQMCQETV